MNRRREDRTRRQPRSLSWKYVSWPHRIFPAFAVIILCKYLYGFPSFTCVTYASPCRLITNRIIILHFKFEWIGIRMLHYEISRMSVWEKPFAKELSSKDNAQSYGWWCQRFSFHTARDLISSFTVCTRRSACSVSFRTYHCTLAMVHSTLFWKNCIILWPELAAYPQVGNANSHMGRRVVRYRSHLFAIKHWFVA